MTKNTWPYVAPLTAAIVTTATFAKSFVPFYLIGSTPIFIGTCLAGLLLIAMTSRALVQQGMAVADVFVTLALLYSAVIASFLINSLHQVPLTHLLGILIFHGMFLLFGFAASRALRVVFAVMTTIAAIYLLIIAHYTIRSGDLMRDGYLHDIFGVGNPAMMVTFHQNIGSALGLAALAAIVLTRGSARLAAYAGLLLAFLFMFHIAARAAIAALVGSILFWAAAAVWARSRRLAIAGLVTIVLATMVVSGLFYQFALRDKNVDAVAPDALSRTIREIQDPRPLFRIQIWARAVDRIVSEPDRLLLGRGIGVYPIDEGFGPPDWLLRPAEGNKYYPHNIYLEVLYEAGLVGLLPFLLLTLFPLVVSLKQWDRYSDAQRTATLLYVFYFVLSQISGAFAFSYDFQFFLGLAIGVVALRREQKEPTAGSFPIRTIQSGVPV